MGSKFLLWLSDCENNLGDSGDSRDCCSALTDDVEICGSMLFLWFSGFEEVQGSE